MKRIRPRKGFALVELLVALAVFGIIMAMMYSVYNSFIKLAARERKAAKTEMDVMNVVWPMIKEIQASGFGIPDDSTLPCFPPIDYNIPSGTVLIHSTATGNAAKAGVWSYVWDETNCDVDLGVFDDGDSVVVLSAVDKSYMGESTINSDRALPCDPVFADSVAFWFDGPPGSPLQCYETFYQLRIYGGGDPRPNTCEANTRKLSRMVVLPDGSTAGFQPMLDCALALDFRFGCVESNGDITWQTGTNCLTGNLRFARLGMIVQSSTWTELQAPPTITLFEDLIPLGLENTIALVGQQRNYKWRIIDQVIILRNAG